MTDHPIVSPEDWLQARKALLEKEKAFSRARDALTAERQALPWVEVTKPYVFDGPDGEETLADLFAGRSQLVVYHFMYGPDWEQGCPTCSFWADNFDGIDVHLAHRDITLLAVSRAPHDTLQAYRERMGWRFKWVSSERCDFNQDFGVTFTPEQRAAGTINYNYGSGGFPSDEAPGVSVFYREADDRVFHTYSTYARGLDMVNGAYHFMDLAPKGRDEAGLPYSMAWLRRRDQYED